MGLLVIGVAVGWKAHAKYAVQKTREKATDAELKRIKEQDDAFHSLTGYSVEQAYGMLDAKPSDQLTKRGE